MKDNVMKTVLLTAFLILSISIIGLFDLVVGLRQGMSRMHLIGEVSVLLVSSGSIIWLVIMWVRMRAEAMSTSACLDQHLRGVADKFNDQFSAWGLTKAESCVALLLIKGLSHQEIADNAGRSERTTRQQAIAVYQKSRLKGRAELAAFFIDDLLTHAKVPAEAVAHRGAGRRSLARTRVKHATGRPTPLTAA